MKPREGKQKKFSVVSMGLSPDPSSFLGNKKLFPPSSPLLSFLGSGIQTFSIAQFPFSFGRRTTKAWSARKQPPRTRFGVRSKEKKAYFMPRRPVSATKSWKKSVITRNKEWINAFFSSSRFTKNRPCFERRMRQNFWSRKKRLLGQHFFFRILFYSWASLLVVEGLPNRVAA